MIEEFRHDLLQTFAGLPVFEFTVGEEGEPDPAALPQDVENWAWRVGVYEDEEPGFGDAFALFLESVETQRVRALIIGCWFFDDPSDTSAEAIALVAGSAERFPALEALFLGDVERERSEVSWLENTDPAALLAAFPRLRAFGVRGTTSLELAPVKHEALEELTFQGGGLPPAVVRALGASQLPALTGLDLYLGSPDYSGGAGPADLAAILDGTAFPRLRHLGLCDAENADEIAAALAHAPVVAQLESLDLALGNLSDEGAAALLAGQPLTHLAKLDLHHHYLSDAMMQRVWAALPGVDVDLDEQEEADLETWNVAEGEEPELVRYIAVAE